MTHRITFNKPASDSFGETPLGVVFRNVAGVLMFRVVTEANAVVEDCSDLYFVGIDIGRQGSLSGELPDAVTELLTTTPRRPFWRITTNSPSSVGWYVLEQYLEAGNPQKHWPWIRVKHPRVTTFEEPVIDEITIALGDFVTIVRAAKALIDQNPLGRPSKSLTVAQEVIKAFRQFVAEVGLEQESDTALVSEAAILLQEFLSRMKGSSTSEQSNVVSISAH